MRYLTFGALVCLLVGAGARVQAQDAQVMAPIKQFMDAFNKGDMAAAAATHTADADLAIIDEVPPYAWRGAQAFKAWSTALDADAKKRGMTEPSVTISAPTRTEMDGDQAYVVVPAVFAFKEKGVPMKESAQMTFVLKKGAKGWLIHAWTWTGPKPQKAAAK
jgi:ketosteroid isomerase-like protein